LGASPSKKSMQRVKVKIGELLVPDNKNALGRSESPVEPRSARLVFLLLLRRPASAYEALDQHIYNRTRHFLRQGHKVQGRRGADQFSREYVYGELAVRCLRRERSRSSP
jgi:RNA-directed DNA polymerase